MLVVEKDVCSESFQDFVLAHAPKEKHFIYSNIPCMEGADNPLMGWAVPRCDQGCPNWRSKCVEFALSLGQCPKQLSEWPVRQGLFSVLLLMLKEGFNPVFLVNLLGFLREKNGIAIEGDSDLASVFFPLGPLPWRIIDSCGGKTGIDGLLDIGIVGR